MPFNASRPAMSAEATRPERRISPRHKVLKGAVLTFNRGFSSFECVVRNWSERGVRLSLGETFAVPASFDLAISGEDQPRKAHVRWRTMNAVGIEFGQATGAEKTQP